MTDDTTPPSWLTAQDTELLGHLWPDAPRNPDVLELYLAAAVESCEAYAPPIPEAGVPAGWRIAQAYQARNTYNAGMVSPSGDMDGGGYGITAYPLDHQVRQLLRPRQGEGVVL